MNSPNSTNYPIQPITQLGTNAQCPVSNVLYMPDISIFIIIGLVAGTLSGLIGIGGGIIIIPALIYFAGVSQHHAQGTTLALMVPPVGILAAYTYYKNGYVDLKIAGLICLGFFIGGYIGAKFATSISSLVLRKVFGSALLLISLKMIFK